MKNSIYHYYSVYKKNVSTKRYKGKQGNVKFKVFKSEKMEKFETSQHFFSSPEPNGQVSFSYQNLSIIRRRWRRWRCHKFFTFSFSSPEPLGQFQPNLAQSILK